MRKKEKRVKGTQDFNQYDESATTNLEDSGRVEFYEPTGGIAPTTKIKTSKFRKIMDKYNFMMLKEEIESYGYQYSFKNFALTALLYVAAMLGICYYVKLQVSYILLLFVLVLAMVPIVVRSQFNQLYQVKRFEMVTSYLDNVLPIFKRTPIITSAWAECLDMLDGEMKVAVTKAYNKVMTNTDDPHVLQSAFEEIEGRFPNSRIHSVNQLMYSIETKNTENYISAVDNIWLDVQAWINRLTMFQKELNDRKSKLLMLSLFTMVSNCLFTSIYTSNELFSTVIDNPLYQLATFSSMALLLIIMVIFQVRLNGKWLLDDKTSALNKKAIKNFEYITSGNYDDSIKPKDKIIALFCLVIGAVVYLKIQNIILIPAFLLIAYMMYTNNRRTFRSNVSSVKRFLTMEFPNWMRDISLNLQTLTVVNSIDASRETSSTIMNHYITGFLNDVFDDTTIKPYNDFLKDFKIEGVRPSMKVLYSLQSVPKEDMQRQIGDMIIRNQALLEKSERMRNEKSVGNLTALGFVPVGVFVIQLLINMVLVFGAMLNIMTVAG